MNATRDLIAAALTLADIDEHVAEMPTTAAATVREMCARAMVQPDMAEVERLADEYATAVHDGRDNDCYKTRTALLDYVRGVLAERDALKQGHIGDANKMMPGGWPCEIIEANFEHVSYRLMEPAPSEQVEVCPCCGSSARVWEYIEKPCAEVMRVVMCDHHDSIGPRGSMVYEGCLLQMPPNDFYHGRGHDAVRYWNEYAKALTALQRKNRWQTAQVQRGEVKP